MSPGATAYHERLADRKYIYIYIYHIAMFSRTTTIQIHSEMAKYDIESLRTRIGTADAKYHQACIDRDRLLERSTKMATANDGARSIPQPHLTR